MIPNFSLGRWFGVPVFLHWSWWLMLLLVAFSNPETVPLFVGVFFIVLLHELGHSLAASQIGAPTNDITLWPFGGIANIDVPIRPKHELFVALAGPAVNVVLIPVFLLMPDYNFCTTLGYYNVMLLVCNMLPALPMDGGRALRAILTLGLKDSLRATKIAARLSQCLCLGLAILGMVNGLLMLVVIAVFIAMAAQSEIRCAEMRQVASQLTGREIHDSAEALRIIRDHRRQYE